MKTVAIVNPTAGYRRARRDWPRLLASLGETGARVATWWTEWPGQAETLAARARREGFERVVAVGGDGTLLEVVNGLWWESRGALPSVGVVPFGTGCDYVRSFDLGRSLRDKVITALGEATLRVSLGLARLQGFDGQPRQRVFVNVLGLGFDARVIASFRQQRLRLPGQDGLLSQRVQGVGPADASPDYWGVGRASLQDRGNAGGRRAGALFRGRPDDNPRGVAASRAISRGPGAKVEPPGCAEPDPQTLRRPASGPSPDKRGLRRPYHD